MPEKVLPLIRKAIFMIGKMSQQLFSDLQKTFANFGQQDSNDYQDEIRLAVESVLRKLNLVTREEFDAQTAVLQRTRTQLAELETQLQSLESRLTMETEADVQLEADPKESAQ